jgi:drug/metabolite transporter (DMT)-like permease
VVTKPAPASPYFGISLKVASALTFTVMAACVKAVVNEFPTGQVMFSRSFFALLPLVIWLWWIGEWPQATRTRHFSKHVHRGVVGLGGMFFGFTTLTYLPLPDATALSYASPLLTVVLAALLLRERVRVYRWSAVAIGFVGVLIMLTPQLDGLSRIGRGGGEAIGAACALTAAICGAFNTIQVRRMTETERTGTIVFYLCVLLSAFSLVSIFGGWRMPTASEAAILVMTGILGGIAQILLTQSFYYADASLIAPFDYTTMIFALAIGWWVFGDFPHHMVLYGAAIVALAGLFVIWREHRLGLARRASRQAAPSRAI